MAKGMKSLQHIPEEKTLECCDIPEKPYFPCLYVDSKQMPEIENWEVGMEYDIKIRVKMKSYSIRENSDRANAELSIEAYERENEKSLD